MPVITPEELIAYTPFEEVKTLSSTLLEYAIVEAVAEVKQVIGHSFEDTTVPTDAKVAYLKLAQFYALINSDTAIVKGYSGEKIGDYSYTYKGETVRKPDVFHLLQSYVQETTVQKRVSFRMRSL